MANLLVVNLASHRPPFWRILTKGQRTTWMTYADPSVKVVTYLGRRENLFGRFLNYCHFQFDRFGFRRISKIFTSKSNHSCYGFQVSNDQKTVRFEIDENEDNFNTRLQYILKWAIEENEFDYLWHSNVSTYLNIPAVVKLLEEAPNENYYAGVIAHFGVDFVSGASVCMSRDVVESVVNSTGYWGQTDFWDVDLGYIINGLQIQATALPRIGFEKVSQIKNYPIEELLQTTNFRCKTSGSRKSDIKIMKNLHRTLRKST